MSRSPVPDISSPQPLTADGCARLVLPWGSQFNREELAEHCVRYPGLAWYLPWTSRYLVAAPWRRRRDILEILEASTGDDGRRQLWRALIEAAEPAAVIVDRSELQQGRGFYKQAGVRELDGVLTMELDALPPEAPLSRLTAQRCTPDDVGPLLSLDAASFPWLWRNSAEELEDYLNAESTSVFGFYWDNALIAYAADTRAARDAHIDRLAVHPDSRGRGYGREALQWLLGRLRGEGCRRAELNTQASNAAALGLYRRAGFRPRRGAYPVYGLILASEDREHV